MSFSETPRINEEENIISRREYYQEINKNMDKKTNIRKLLECIEDNKISTLINIKNKSIYIDNSSILEILQNINLYLKYKLIKEGITFESSNIKIIENDDERYDNILNSKNNYKIYKTEYRDLNEEERKKYQINLNKNSLKRIFEYIEEPFNNIIEFADMIVTQEYMSNETQEITKSSVIQKYLLQLLDIFYIKIKNNDYYIPINKNTMYTIYQMVNDNVNYLKINLKNDYENENLKKIKNLKEMGKLLRNRKEMYKNYELQILKENLVFENEKLLQEKQNEILEEIEFYKNQFFEVNDINNKKKYINKLNIDYILNENKANINYEVNDFENKKIILTFENVKNYNKNSIYIQVILDDTDKKYLINKNEILKFFENCESLNIEYFINSENPKIKIPVFPENFKIFENFEIIKPIPIIINNNKPKIHVRKKYKSNMRDMNFTNYSEKLDKKEQYFIQKSIKIFS